MRRRATRRAVAQFERMIQLVPDEAIGHYHLGSCTKLEGRSGEAVAQFELAAKLNPQLAAAQFQLYNFHRQEGHAEEAGARAGGIPAAQEAGGRRGRSEDVDWCVYAEIYDPPAAPRAIPPATTPVYEDHVLEGTAAGLLAIDSTGEGLTDLLAWSARGVVLYRHGSELVPDSGLEGLTGVISVAAGDFNNDGFMDLCVLTESGPCCWPTPRDISAASKPICRGGDSSAPYGWTTITITISTWFCWERRRR